MNRTFSLTLPEVPEETRSTDELLQQVQRDLQELPNRAIKIQVVFLDPAGKQHCKGEITQNRSDLEFSAPELVYNFASVLAGITKALKGEQL